MRWPGKKKGGGGPSPEVQTGPSAKTRDWGKLIPIWLGAVAAALAIGGAGWKVAPTIHDWIDPPEDVTVELAEVTVSNPRNTSLLPETEPAVTATVRNRGDHTAWIDEARITVFDGTRLRTCFTQGGGPDVPVSKPYRVTMPEFPNAEEQVIHQHLHVEVQPGHGVRPLLKFQKRFTSTTDLYAIDVRYVVDPGEEILDAGRFVIGIPGPPARGGYVLPEDQTDLTAEEFRGKPLATGTYAPVNPVTSWCLRGNLEGARRLAAEPGRRSAEIASLSHLQPAPAWPEIEDREPPREAVEVLFEAEDLDSPMYAVEAAEETGDAAYEEEVRKRAVARLLELGEENLGDSATVSIGAAERALSLERTQAGSDLLDEAKVAAAEQEERL